MEINSYYDIRDRERSIWVTWCESQFPIAFTIPENASVADSSYLFSFNVFTFGREWFVQVKPYFLTTYYTYADKRFCMFILVFFAFLFHECDVSKFCVDCCLLNLTYCYFVEYAFNIFLCQGVVIFLYWSNDESRHVKCSGTYEVLFLTIGIIAQWSVSSPREYYYNGKFLFLPCYYVHHWFLVIYLHWHGVV